MIDVHALRTLLAVEATGSVTAAAAALEYTPAAISHQLRRLGRQVGGDLTERTGRGIALTPLGRELCARGAGVLRALEQLQAEVRAPDAEPNGRITVGGPSTGLRGILAPALPLLAARAPDLQVANVEDEPDVLLEKLLSGRIDAALLFDWEDRRTHLPATLRSTALVDDPADVIMHRDHRLAGRARVTLADVRAETWTSAPRNAICHRWLLSLFAGSDVQPRIEHWALEYDTQLAFVTHAGALALVPRVGRSELGPELVAVELADSTIARTIRLVWRASMDRAPAIGALRTTLAEVAQRLGPGVRAL